MAETILDGGTRTTQDQFTGRPNELTVDQSNRNLRLHDGVTPGGFTLQSQDNADQRYQGFSNELVGLTGFEPQERGILARVGPGDYRLRILEADSESLTLTNANGFSGNPRLTLAATILSSHQWNGQHIFNDVVEFNNGINADVSGTLFGTVNGNVVGDVTGNLLGNADGSHTGRFTGIVDVRGKAFLLDDGQIAPEKIANFEPLIRQLGFPAGGIIMWSGNIASIPAGWFLCDGLNGTPDLRNQFIVAAGNTVDDYAPGERGGANAVTPIATVEESGAHTHSVSGDANTASTGITLTVSLDSSAVWDRSGGSGNPVTSVVRNDPSHSHTLTGTAESNGAHTHAASIAELDNRPPYYALAFLMKG